MSDFGLAKRLAVDLTRSQAVMGTPQYMAPEQAGGKAKFVGPQADVYALGVILYECLTGSVPFKDDGGPWSVVRQVIEDAPEPPRKRVPAVPRDLELICLKCLEKEPHHRYPTAAALADDLKRFLDGQPVSVRPIGPFTRAARWAKRRPYAALGLALGAVLTLILPPLGVWAKGSYDQRETDAIQAREREDIANKLAESANQTAIEAKRAEDAAKRATTAAEDLARAQELFGLRTRLRNRAATRPLGWTAATRTDVSRALALARNDPEVTGDLRSAAVGALLAADLLPLAPCAEGMTSSSLATDPKSGRVAVGEFKSRGDGRVLIIDPVSGATLRTLTYPTEFRIDAQDGTRGCAFSPDGTRLYVGTRASKVFRFDLDKPANVPVKSWSASDQSLDRVAVSPDGKTVYALTRTEGVLYAWDAETGARRWQFASDDKVALESFVVLPSGDLFTGTHARFYHVKSDGSRAGVRMNVPTFQLAVVGTLILVSDGAELNVHHRDTVEPTDRFADPGLRRAAHEQYIKSFAVHPSGAFVATEAGITDRAVKVWELASGRLVATATVPGSDPMLLGWSGDGTVLLVTAGRHVARWRLEVGAAQRFACFSGFVLEAATPLGDRVAALGESYNHQRELLVGAPGGTVSGTFFPEAGGNGCPGLAAAPDGTLAVTMQMPGIRHWCPGTDPPAPRLTKSISWRPRFGPDGDLWALVDAKEVQRFDPTTAKLQAKWRNKYGAIISGLSALDALAVGRKVAVTGGVEGTVFVLDPKTCEPTALFRRAGDPILAVALTPDDALAVAGAQKGDLRLIRITDKTELSSLPAHPGGVTALSINRDGTLLATGGHDRTVRLWRRTGDTFEPLFAAQTAGVPRELHFGPTDNRVIALFAQEHAVRVWDIDRLKAQLAELGLGW